MVKTRIKDYFVLFATRETPNESLGFTPFEFIFGHEVRGPLKLLKEQWLSGKEEVNLLTYVADFKERLQECWRVAKENCETSKQKMKV